MMLTGRGHRGEFLVRPAAAAHVTSAPEPEHVQRAQQVRVEPAEVGTAQFRDRPPTDPGEFTLIRLQGLPNTPGQGEPEADVHVPQRRRPHGLGHREEERPVPERRVELRGNAEFFDHLPPDRVKRMLAGLDTARTGCRRWSWRRWRSGCRVRR